MTRRKKNKTIQKKLIQINKDNKKRMCNYTNNPKNFKKNS